MISLELINPKQKPEQNQEAIRKNFDKIQAKLNLSGSQLLASVFSTDAQAASGSDYETLTDFSKGFVTSAGILCIEASFAVQYTNKGAFAMYLNGQLVSSKQVNGSGQGVVSFLYKKSVLADKHSVEFKFKGAVAINTAESGYEDSPTSEMFVTELFNP